MHEKLFAFCGELFFAVFNMNLVFHISDSEDGSEIELYLLLHSMFNVF